MQTETSSPKKKPAKKPAKKITAKKSRKEEAVDEAADEVETDIVRAQSKFDNEEDVTESSFSSIFGSSDDDESSEEDSSDYDIEAEAEENNEVMLSPPREELEPDLDVFDFAFRKATKVGDIPKFIIYKNGERLTTKRGSYSYENLQAEYGGGQYKVFAYLNHNNQYIKGQSRLVAEPKKAKTEEETNQGMSSNGFDIVEIMKTMKSMSEEKKSLEAEAIRAKTDHDTTNMTLLMQMMTQQNQMQMQMIQKSNQDNMKMMELMLQGVAQATKQKSESLGLKDILLLLEGSKKSAKEEMKSMLELAREMAQTMAANNDDEDEDEKEDLPTQILKTLGPSIVGALAAPKAQPQHLQYPQQQPPRQFAPPAPQAPLPYKAPEAVQAAPPATEPARTAPARPITGELGALSLKEDDDEAELEESDIELAEESDLNEGEEYVETAKEVYEEDENEGVIVAKELTPQDAIIDVITADLVQGFVMNKKSSVVAANCGKKLKKSGWTTDQVLKAFPDEASILDAASRKSLPESLHGKLKEFYGELSLWLRANGESQPTANRV